MPRDLNLDPHPEQVEVMTALGFRRVPNDPHSSGVLWHGPHDLTFEMDAGEKPTLATACAAAIHAAQFATKHGMQRDLQKLIGLRCPQ